MEVVERMSNEEVLTRVTEKIILNIILETKGKLDRIYYENANKVQWKNESTEAG